MSLCYASAAYQVELTKNFCDKTLQLNVCIIPSVGKICVMGIYAFLSSASSIRPSKNICEKFLNDLSVTTSIYIQASSGIILLKLHGLNKLKVFLMTKPCQRKKQFKLLIVFFVQKHVQLGPGMDGGKPDAAGSYIRGACSQSKTFSWKVK